MNIVIDTHTHTIASGHAYSTLDENIRYAAQKGLEILVSTDHAPALIGSTNEIFFKNYGTIPRTLHAIEVMMGVELNILNFSGEVDLVEKILKKMDLVIASLHVPVIQSGSKEENTNALVMAAKNPYIDILGHPGDPHYPINMKTVFEAAAQTGTFLELNNASLLTGGSRAGGESYLAEMLTLCKKNAVPIVVSSDAHFYSKIGDFSHAIQFMKEHAFPEQLVINTSVDKFRQLFRQKKRE